MERSTSSYELSSLNRFPENVLWSGSSRAHRLSIPGSQGSAHDFCDNPRDDLLWSKLIAGFFILHTGDILSGQKRARQCA
jgi:hypothetical protein